MPTRISSTRQAGSTTPSDDCGQFAVSGNGRRSTSHCASCASRTPFPLPISVSCARWPVWNDASIPYPNFLIEPMCGGLGVPMLRNTYGLRPERCYCAGAWQAYWPAYSFSVTPCCRNVEASLRLPLFSASRRVGQECEDLRHPGRVSLEDRKQIPGKQARAIASSLAECARLAGDAAPIEMWCGPLGDRQSQSTWSARVRKPSAPRSLSAQHEMGRKFGCGTFGHDETKRL